MALIDTVRRLARLGFYLGLGAVSAAIDACGGSSPTPDTPDTVADTPGETTGNDDGAAPDEAAASEDVVEPGDDVAATDGDGAADDGEDLWDIVCE